jgi:hypothetical protein
MKFMLPFGELFAAMCKRFSPMIWMAFRRLTIA